MEHFHDEIRIEAPVEHVWALYKDTAQWPDWMPRAKSWDFTGPVDQVGTTYLQSMKLLGFEFKSTVKVVEVEPLRLIHEHLDQGPEDNYLRFKPDGDATLVTIDSDYEWPSHMPGFVKDFMSGHWMERNVHHMLQDFKALAETTVPVPA